MKKKDRNDLKTKELKDLNKILGDLRKDLTKEKIELKMGNTKNVHATKNIKKQIANVLTFMTLKKKIEMSKPNKERKNKEGKLERTRKENK